MSLINGTFTRNVSVAFAVLLSAQQEVEIPAFSIPTNKGRIQVPAAQFAPAGATVGSSGVSLGVGGEGDAGAVAAERVGGRGLRPEVHD